MQRDLYIDFTKGLATLSVIFIHTAYWSGQLYAPPEIRAASLLLDVVLFFALSGLTAGGNVDKTLYRLLKLQITYMLFVTLIFALDYLFKVVGLQMAGETGLKSFYSIFGEKYVPAQISAWPQWQNLGNWYVHSYSNADTFPVIMGSFWYLKVYFILTLFGVLAIRFFPKHIPWITTLCFTLTSLYNIVPAWYPTGQVGYVSFYLGIFLSAYMLKGKQLSKTAAACLSGAVIAAFAYLLIQNGGEFILKINKYKFPPKWPYILWILPGVILLLYGYNRLKINKKSILTFIGENAIFFYFAQGISSTLLYFVAAAAKDYLPWFVLMPILFILNAVAAVGLAILLKKYDALAWAFLEKLRQKTAMTS